MYKAGLIDREFINIDFNRVAEMITSGRAGLFYGLFAAPLWFPEMENMNPGSKLMSYPAPSADGKKVEIMVNNPITTYYVVNKKFAHPEVLIKTINLHFMVNDDSNLESQYLMNSPSGYSYHQLSPGWNEVPEKNHTMQQKLKAVLKTGDTSGLNPEELNSYVGIQRYYSKNGNIPTDWAIERIFGPDGSSFDSIDYYVRNNMLSLNPFTGAPTKTMISRLSNLNDLRDEVFTKIIMGTSSLNAFDTFVQDWKRQGGDDITREVNEWYKTR
jgi:putative aldouronate transport system substrate-binding protein